MGLWYRGPRAVSAAVCVRADVHAKAVRTRRYRRPKRRAAVALTCCRVE
jgi:hypothetical protein